ncbi:hypothetical protein EON82_08830 [bacterium]|nr:MAG: hypothetical protein EON82_08830 [bacterium]
MERAYRLAAVVGPEGRVELSAPELTPGTEVEAILLVRNSDEAEREALINAILQGEEDVEAGRTRPAASFFTEQSGRYAVSG